MTSGAPPEDRVRLLWTGGWDSTFRLLQLLLVESRPVDPIYVVRSRRLGTLEEIRAMEEIRAGVLPRLATPGLLGRTEVLIAGEFPVPRHLEQLRRSIEERAHIGGQYLWLAAVGEAQDWSGVELCMERYAEGPSALQQLLFTPDGKLSAAPEAALFRFWSFPVLNLTKEEMRGIAERHGFLDLLLKRWFCHMPVNGRPCGVCRPCKLANPDGVKFAHPAVARTRQAWQILQAEGAATLGRRAVTLLGRRARPRRK